MKSKEKQNSLHDSFYERMAKNNDENGKHEIVEIRVNKTHIRHLIDKETEIRNKLRDFKNEFDKFKNQLLFGLLGIIGVLIGAIVTIFIS